MRELRKRRTRGHVIADLAINHLERLVLRSGHVLQRVERDYGLDLFMYSFNPDGEVENGDERFQVKATERLSYLANRPLIPWRLLQSDLRHWLNEPMPVVFVVYEAEGDRAFWLFLQDYFEGRRRFGLTGTGRSVTVHISLLNELTDAAVREFTQFRDVALSRLQGGLGPK